MSPKMDTTNIQLNFYYKMVNKRKAVVISYRGLRQLCQSLITKSQSKTFDQIY